MASYCTGWPSRRPGIGKFAMRNWLWLMFKLSIWRQKRTEKRQKNGRMPPKTAYPSTLINKLLQRIFIVV
ncbi:hypothetical protein L596_016869 [Steinernema carpocapsae]|uniref:Uncharacterized protein n=1 Tax=Steinernema carpocapsae TaxID=34508 RepID=A0A4U5NKD1_STECR|nr:hypothetical protein L596_016869 [Steinernema carpocapsae]